MSQITLAAAVYNERHRLGPWLDQNSRWADVILIFDKESTDGTADLARSCGATVVTIPFTQGGHEDWTSLSAHIPTDWFVWSTPSQCFTPRLVQYFRFAVENDDGVTDTIFAMNKVYSFGKHNPNLSNMKHWVGKLHHKGRVDFGKKAHAHVISRGHVKYIQDEEAYVLHLAQSSYENFMTRTIDYTDSEVGHLNSDEELKNAARDAMLRSASADFELLSSGEHDIRHFLAWKISTYVKALACLDKTLRSQTDQVYQNLRSELTHQWSLVPKRQPSTLE
jgi:hypothetical protein